MTPFNSPTAKLTTGSQHSAKERDHVSGSSGTETAVPVVPTSSLVPDLNNKSNQLGVKLLLHLIKLNCID